MKFIVLDNDGIGPEITAATLPALERVNDMFGLGIELVHRVGGLRAYEATGQTIPDDVLEDMRAADGVIFGPVSTFEYPKEIRGIQNPSKFIRKNLNLFANIRPARTRADIPSVVEKMDLVIVRENTEGFYADRNMYEGVGEFMPTEDVALSVRKITRQASMRIAEEAFKLAQTRRKKVTAVHKANVLRLTDGLFLECVRTVAKDYPDIELEELIVDAAAAHLVRRPEDFDVLVTTNAFGDILSDLASELSGSLGLAGSINAGTDHVVAQAQHGSAPDIAGKGIANPGSLILSVAMMLTELGIRTGRNDLARAGAAVERGVDDVLIQKAHRTRDLGGKASTQDFGLAVASAIVSDA